MKRTFLQLNYIAKKYLTAVLVFGYFFIQAQGQITINKRLLDNHDNISSKEIDKVLSTVQVNLEKYMQAVVDLNSADTDQKKQRFESLFYKTANTKIYIDYRSDVEDLQYKKTYFADYYTDLYKAAPKGLGVNMLTVRKKIGVSAISKLNDGYDCEIHIEKAFSEMVSNQREENEYILKKSPLSSAKSVGLLLKYRVSGDSALIYDIERAPLPDFPTNEAEWSVSINSLWGSGINPKIDFFELKSNISTGGEINFGCTIQKMSISVGVGILTNNLSLNQSSTIEHKGEFIDTYKSHDSLKVVLKNLEPELKNLELQLPITIKYRFYRSRNEKFSLSGRVNFITNYVVKSEELVSTGSLDPQFKAEDDPQAKWISDYERNGVPYYIHNYRVKPVHVKHQAFFMFKAGLGLEMKYKIMPKLHCYLSSEYSTSITPILRGNADLLLNYTDDYSRGLLQFTAKEIKTSGINLRLGLDYSF